MNLFRTLSSYLLIGVAILVGVVMIFDIYFGETAGAVWEVVDWIMAIALIIGLVVGTRRLTLAGLDDTRAKIELLGTVFVSVLFFHTWLNFINGGTVADDTWMLIDALVVAVTLSVGLRLRRSSESATEESES